MFYVEDLIAFVLGERLCFAIVTDMGCGMVEERHIAQGSFSIAFTPTASALTGSDFL